MVALLPKKKEDDKSSWLTWLQACSAACCSTSPCCSFEETRRRIARRTHSRRNVALTGKARAIKPPVVKRATFKDIVEQPPDDEEEEEEKRKKSSMWGHVLSKMSLKKGSAAKHKKEPSIRAWASALRTKRDNVLDCNKPLPSPEGVAWGCLVRMLPLEEAWRKADFKLKLERIGSEELQAADRVGHNSLLMYIAQANDMDALELLMRMLSKESRASLAKTVNNERFDIESRFGEVHPEFIGRLKMFLEDRVSVWQRRMTTADDDVKQQATRKSTSAIPAAPANDSPRSPSLRPRRVSTVTGKSASPGKPASPGKRPGSARFASARPGLAGRRSRSASSAPPPPTESPGRSASGFPAAGGFPASPADRTPNISIRRKTNNTDATTLRSPKPQKKKRVVS